MMKPNSWYPLVDNSLTRVQALTFRISTYHTTCLLDDITSYCLNSLQRPYFMVKCNSIS